MKLGKRSPKFIPNLPKLGLYTVELPKAPIIADWTYRLSDLGMMGNDTLGDCTCATVGHIIQIWTANASKQVILPDSDIITLYERACGYDPKVPDSDQGGIVTDVLKYWLANPVDGHSITAFAQIHPANTDEVKDAIWLMGAAYMGVQLPTSAQRQTIWDVPSEGTKGDGEIGSWGGHAVPVVAYNDLYLTCITWGKLQKMTWNFWKTYTDEAYAVLSRDWVTAGGEAVSGFDFNELQVDMGSL